MATTKLRGAVRNMPYELEFVIKDDGVAVDMTSKAATLVLDTYPTSLTIDQTSGQMVRGADGKVSVTYTADQMNQRPGDYDLQLVLADVASEPINEFVTFRIAEAE